MPDMSPVKCAHLTHSMVVRRQRVQINTITKVLLPMVLVEEILMKIICLSSKPYLNAASVAVVWRRDFYRITLIMAAHV